MKKLRIRKEKIKEIKGLEVQGRKKNNLRGKIKDYDRE